MAKSIIGFHYSIGGNKNGIGAFMEKLNQSGIPFLMKGVDDAGLCFEGQQKGEQYGVTNYLIYRVSTAGQGDIIQYDVPDYTKSPLAAAEEHFDKTAAKWPQELNGSEVWMEPINEPRAKLSEGDVQYQNMHPVDWLGSFMLEYALLANAQGFKVCGPSFNSGEPEVFGTNDYELPGMLAYLGYCAANPEKAALSVHEYTWIRWKLGESWPNWYPNLWGRVEAAMAAADKHNIPRTFQIFVTEWGFAPQESPRWPECEPHLTAYNEWAARWPQVKGVAAWTLQAGWGNVDHDLQSWFADLADYAVSTNFPTGEQPTRTHEKFGGTLPGESCLEARTDYDRVFYVAPDDADEDLFAEIARLAFNDGRRTVGFSSDDAGIGNGLRSKTVVEFGIPADKQQDYVEFYQTHYPDVATLQFRPNPPAAAAPISKLKRAINQLLVGETGCIKARIPYNRVYWVADDDCTEGEFVNLARLAFRDGRRTIGMSSDDAGIGDGLASKSVVEFGIPESEQVNYINFYGEFYPDVSSLEFRPMPGTSTPSAGLDSPVGLTGPPSGEVYPPYWVDVNPIGRHYTFGSQGQYKAYHTGADLNCGFPVPNSDYLAPTYAIGDGKVVFAGKLGGTWWNVVVTEHEQPSGIVVYARHSHLESYSVQTGDYVFKGQQIGIIGDAGGKLPAHLHFDTSLSNILLTNPGHWPGENLTDVMQHYVEPRSLIRISRAGFTNQTIYIKSNANLRSGPATTFRAYKTLATGTAVTALGKIDDYYLVKTAASEYGFVYGSLTQDTPPGGPPIPPEGNARLGLHASADPGDLQAAEIQEFKLAKPGVIKVLSAHSGPSIAALANQHPGIPFVVRVFLDFGGRVIAPTQFFNDTINDTRRAIDAIGSGREIWVELHNEPNLTSEGLGASWVDGAAFNSWLLSVLSLYKAALPAVKYMYPGLSPQFTGYRSFLLASQQAAMACNGIGVHCYWSNTYSMNQALADTVDWYRGVFGNRPLWVTEASHNKDGKTPTEKAQQYIAFWQALKERLSVAGVTYFVASASNPVFGWNGGSCETWIGTGISAIVGGR